MILKELALKLVSIEYFLKRADGERGPSPSIQETLAARV